jgi:hypothetical protein
MGRVADDTMNAILDLLLGSGHAGFMPSSVDIALSTTAPTNTGTNVTEPTGPSYARVQVTNDNTHWPAATGRQKANGTAITFPQPTGPWGTVGWAAIYDHGVTGPTGYRAWVELQTHRAIDAASDPPRFPAGAFVINGPGA